ncbi:hypothetical protein Q7P37_010774 [Cladosporium fusiforme]
MWPATFLQIQLLDAFLSLCGSASLPAVSSGASHGVPSPSRRGRERPPSHLWLVFACFGRIVTPSGLDVQSSSVRARNIIEAACRAGMHRRAHGLRRQLKGPVCQPVLVAVGDQQAADSEYWRMICGEDVPYSSLLPPQRRRWHSPRARAMSYEETLPVHSTADQVATAPYRPQSDRRTPR